MTLIEIIIKPFKLDEVKENLEKIGIKRFYAQEVKGHGRQRGHTELYRGPKYEVYFLPKILIKVVVPDKKIKKTIDAIMKSARTGRIGDGKIFINNNIIQVVDIRTGKKMNDNNIQSRFRKKINSIEE